MFKFIFLQILILININILLCDDNIESSGDNIYNNNFDNFLFLNDDNLINLSSENDNDFINNILNENNDEYILLNDENIVNYKLVNNKKLYDNRIKHNNNNNNNNLRKMYKNGPKLGQSSLVIVFDATGSMVDDLEQLRQGAKMIIEKITKRDDNPIYNYIFVPFRDPRKLYNLDLFEC